MSKWIKGRLHTSLGFIKVDLEAKVEVDNKIFSPTIGLLAEKETETEEIIIITIGTIIGPTIEIDQETITDVTTEEIATSLMKDEITIDKTIGGEINTDKTIEIGKIIEEMTPDKDTETGVKVGIDQEIIVMTVLEVETEIETDGFNLDPELCQMTEKDQGPDLAQE